MLYFLSVVCDFPFHAVNITNLLYSVNRQAREQPGDEPTIFNATPFYSHLRDPWHSGDVLEMQLWPLP